jgi:hypothetical protein
MREGTARLVRWLYPFRNESTIRNGSDVRIWGSDVPWENPIASKPRDNWGRSFSCWVTSSTCSSTLPNYSCFGEQEGEAGWVAQKRTKVARWSSFESGLMYTACMNIPGCISSTRDWNLRRPDPLYESPVRKAQPYEIQFLSRRSRKTMILTKPVPDDERARLRKCQEILCWPRESLYNRSKDEYAMILHDLCSQSLSTVVV